MIPYLYPQAQENFILNGYNSTGRLAECISCKITENLSGVYEMEIQYPTNGKFAKELLGGNGMIAAVMPIRSLTYSTSNPEVGNVAKKLQLFDIRNRVIQDDIITLTCHHVSYRLNNYCVNGISWFISPPYTLTRTMNNLLGSAVPTMSNGSFYTPFSWRDTYTGNRQNKFESAATKSVRAFLIDSWYSIQSEYKVEIQFDNWEIQIFTQRGRDEDYEVRLGRNFASGQYTKDETETFNAILPYWVREGQGKVVCNPLLVQPTTPITPIKAVVKDFTNAFENQPTAGELETYTRAYLDDNQPWLPAETTHIEIFPLDEFGKFKHEITPKLALGDTLTVYWGDANVVGQKMRIVSAVFDSLKEEYETLELGDIQKGYVVTGEW